MSVHLIPITSVQLPTAAASLYTCPANVTAKINKITLCNTTETARNYTGYIVPSGGTAVATNECYSAVTIAARETQELSEIEGMALAAGDSLQIISDAVSAVTITGSMVVFG